MGWDYFLKFRLFTGKLHLFGESLINNEKEIRNCYGKYRLKKMYFMETSKNKKTRIDMAIDIESKCNLLIFSTLAKSATRRQRQAHRSNVLYATALRKFYQSQQN